MKIVVIAALLLSLGCTKKGAEQKKDAPPPNTTARQLIHGFTGKTAADSGRRARAQIEAVTAKKNEDLDEVFKD